MLDQGSFFEVTARQIQLLLPTYQLCLRPALRCPSLR